VSRIVVIGGSGFLGSRLVQACSGHEVVSLDILPPERPLPGHVSPVVGDARDPAVVRDVIQSADAIWLRSGRLGGAVSTRIEEAAGYIEQNTEILHGVLAACAAAGCHRVYYDSSEQVFGVSGDLQRQDAGAEPWAVSYYGASKAISEKLLRLWSAGDDRRSVQIFRYSRVRAGNTRDVIYYMTRSARAGDPIRIIGNPAHRISFVHVEDVISANCRALNLSPRFAIYNVSCDRPQSLLDLAQLTKVITASNSPIEINEAALSPGFEPFVVGMEWESSARVLGLTPRWSVAAMIEETARLLALN
jgi:UDP-glucose 4-epimerase